MSPARKIKFRCSDDVVLRVDEAVALHSPRVRQVIESTKPDNDIYSLDCVSYIAGRIFDYFKSLMGYLHHEVVNDTILERLNTRKIEYNSALDAVGVRILEEELKSRDALEELKDRKAKFVNVDDDTLFELISGVNYLNIQELLDLTRQNLLDRISRNINIVIPGDICELFNIWN